MAGQLEILTFFQTIFVRSGILLDIEVVLGSDDEGRVSQLRRWRRRRRRQEAKEASGQPLDVDVGWIVVKGGRHVVGQRVPAGDRLLPQPARAVRDVQPVRSSSGAEHGGLERAVCLPGKTQRRFRSQLRARGDDHHVRR